MPSPIPIPDFTTQPESPEPSSLPDLSPFSNYITQEEVPEKPIPTDYNTQRLGVPTHQEAHTHQPSACITPKNCVQVDLWGKKVPASKLKIKVRSYRKRNGTAVSKYSRKSVNKLAFKPKKTQVSFKDLNACNNSCPDSIKLAHSLYFEELRSSIHSVGKTGNSRNTNQNNQNS